jgi:hypothetical protein
MQNQYICPDRTVIWNGVEIPKSAMQAVARQKIQPVDSLLTEVGMIMVAVEVRQTRGQTDADNYPSRR